MKKKVRVKTNKFSWVFSWLQVRLSLDMDPTSSVESCLQGNLFSVVEYRLDEWQGVQSINLFLRDCICDTEMFNKLRPGFNKFLE